MSRGGRIGAVGRIASSGTEEIDAKGRLVTPGFVDIHTHYDGQAVWDPHTFQLPTTIVIRSVAPAPKFLNRGNRL